MLTFRALHIFFLVDEAIENVEAIFNFFLLYIMQILFGCLKVVFFMCETQDLSETFFFLIYLRQDLIKWLRLFSDSKASNLILQSCWAYMWRHLDLALTLLKKLTLCVCMPAMCVYVCMYIDACMPCYTRDTEGILQESVYYIHSVDSWDQT